MLKKTLLNEIFVYIKVGITMITINTTIQAIQQVRIYFPNAVNIPVPYLATEKAIKDITPIGEVSITIPNI